MEELEIRPCLPEDVDDAVPLIYSSGPPSFDYVFRNKRVLAIHFLHFAFQRAGGEFSYDNHYALIRRGRLIGIGALFSASQARRFVLREFVNIVQFYKGQAASVVIRGLRIERILKPPKENEMYLGHIAVAEDERNRGYGQKLIKFMMRQMEGSPCVFVLDVSEDNPRALRLYERMGFQVTSKICSKYCSKFGYVPNFFRMAKSEFTTGKFEE